MQDSYSVIPKEKMSAKFLMANMSLLKSSGAIYLREGRGGEWKERKGRGMEGKGGERKFG